jgi:hypothetical protein
MKKAQNLKPDTDLAVFVHILAAILLFFAFLELVIPGLLRTR